MNRLIDFNSRFRILKGGKISLVVSALLGSTVIANAAPSGGVVTSGSANISSSGNTTNIIQNTNKVTINWNKFNIASDEIVNFKQPNVNSIALNRVIGNEKSIINGALNANGQVWILNSNGVLFGKNAKINTAGLLATTKNLSDEDFNAGNYNFKGSSTESVVNLGEIDISDSGYATLLANNVSNEGTIKAVKGTVRLVGADEVTINLNGNSIVDLTVNKGVLDSLVENKGAVYADGGEIYLTTNAVDELLKGVVNNEGIIEANSLDGVLGDVKIASNIFINTGEIKAQESNVKIKTGFFNDAGTIDVSSVDKKAGNINIEALQISQSSKSNLKADSVNSDAGTITITSDVNDDVSDFYLSGNISAKGKNGGDISITANDVAIVGANIDASGEQKAGTIKLGGDWQGKETSLDNTKKIFLSSNTNITNSGENGTIVVWSDEQTTFGAKVLAKDSKIEVSSKENLNFDGSQLAVKSLLLDPKNIEIVDGIDTLSFLKIDAINSGFDFGNSVTELSNKNLVIIQSNATIGGINSAGAVYLYNENGVLISTLTGTTAGDKVGNDGVIALSNGNYVVSSNFWDNGTATNAGAVTWGNGDTGISGVVSASNSLVGTQTNDEVGNRVTALSNGNYVVRSTYWDNGTATDAGAVTWGDGTTGISGVVSASNSLVGTQTNDKVGNAGVTALSNGNYVVISSSWDNGTATNAGAVTWGNGDTGISGAVNTSNSLVGTQENDYVGYDGVTELTNGNYVVRSTSWDNGTATDAGAVTWGNGDTGISGVVSASNSLVGTQENDYVGNGVVTVLSNGNYVVRSTSWNNGTAINAGAVTWGNGDTGISGVVSASNSLVGTQANDKVGNGVTVLSNGNYVVRSTYWNNGTATEAGAVTWGDGTTGISGVVSDSNSLVGTQENDYVGNNGVIALSNGNYVVRSTSWDNGTATDAGAVTWGDGTSGISGAVNTSNSLVGTTAGDKVGYDGVIALSNGNYVVSSNFWDNGTATDAGAVTWGNGTTGISGAVSDSNSLVGTKEDDQVGNGVTALSNGNYVVSSTYWDNGSATNAGAVTWGDGTTGISGVVSDSNSLVGTQANDKVGNNGVIALSNGNYVVRSTSWDNGTATDAGAVTWGDGTSGISGAVNTSNSLVGTQANDKVGNGGVTALSNGNYVVRSNFWDNGTATEAGAVTWGDGTTGISGAVSASNSLVGTQTDDKVGNTGVKALSNGNYVVRSFSWDNGTVTDAGAVTWGDGTSGISGAVSASNSLVGTQTDDKVGNYQVTALNTSNRVAVKIGESIYIIDGTTTTNTFDSVASATFANNPSANSQVSTNNILALLNAGTDVTLQANNDITLTDELIANNSSGNGGKLTLQAGKDININNNITTDNGNFTAVAGDTNADSTYTDEGTPTITIKDGVVINTGTGNIDLVASNGKFVNNATSNPFISNRINIYLPTLSAATLGDLTADKIVKNTTYADGCKTAGCTLPTEGINILLSEISKTETKPTTETPNTDKNINKVITTIVNKESVNVPTPVKVTTTPNNAGKNTNVTFNIGENRQLVSKPIEGQATKIVSMSEARQMQQEAGTPVNQDVKVPLSRDSILVLVNGGVLLPGSLEQQFFVSENNN